MRWIVPLILPLAACHTILGIEDTVRGDPESSGVGLDRIVVAEVRSPQMPAFNGPGPAVGPLILVDFLQDAAPEPVYDDRDARGFGCVVHERDAISIAHTRDEGDVEIQGTRQPIPACRPFGPVTSRYACAEMRSSGPGAVDVTNDPDGRATALVNGATPGFGPADVGRYLQLGEAPPRPIVEVGGPDEATLFDPFTAGEQHPVQEHAVITGLGPNPTSQPLFDGPIVVSVAGGQELDGFGVNILPAGATYRLSADGDRPGALPIDGRAAVFRCDDPDGNCSDGTHFVVWGRTTDQRGAALPPSDEPTPIASREAELRCLFDASLGAEVTVPEGAMQALLDTAPRRIFMAVMRGNVETGNNLDGSHVTAVFAGFGEYGWTSISRPEDDCDGVFQDCSPGQRCTVVANGPDFVPRCLSPGADIPVGESCVSSPPDDCVGGSLCFFDTCKSICDVEDGPCGGNEVCIAASNFPFGACADRCDPIAQGGCATTSACYIAGSDGFCAQEGVGSPGDPCELFNDCTAGTQCRPSENGNGNTVCRPLCDLSACPPGPSCGCGGCLPNQVCRPSEPGSPVGFCFDDVDTQGCDCNANPPC